MSLQTKTKIMYALLGILVLLVIAAGVGYAKRRKRNADSKANGLPAGTEANQRKAAGLNQLGTGKFVAIR